MIEAKATAGQTAAAAVGADMNGDDDVSDPMLGNGKSAIGGMSRV